MKYGYLEKSSSGKLTGKCSFVGLMMQRRAKQSPSFSSETTFSKSKVVNSVCKNCLALLA